VTAAAPFSADSVEKLDGRPVCAKRSELPTQLAQIQETVNPAEEMVLGDMVLKAKRVEQLLLLPALASHHRAHPRHWFAQI